MSDLEIRLEDRGSFAEHGLIAISFEARSRIDLEALRGGRIEEVHADAFVKDYDAQVEERPEALALRPGSGNWVLLAAFERRRRVGGAIVARNGRDYPLVAGGEGLGVIVDLRVLPELRGQGVGRAVVSAATRWAEGNGLSGLIAETQDTNPGACRFYASLGFEARSVVEGAYGDACDEAQILWIRRLERRSRRATGEPQRQDGRDTSDG